MSIETITTFNNTLHKSNEWIQDFQAELPETATSQDAYHGLRAALHFVRDRLTITEAAHLSAQLPMLIRGLYYESWQPIDTPIEVNNMDEITAYFSDAINRDMSSDPTVIMRAFFSVLYKHISEGELDHIQSMLPAETRAFWPNIVKQS